MRKKSIEGWAASAAAAASLMLAFAQGTASAAEEGAATDVVEVTAERSSTGATKLPLTPHETPQSLTVVDTAQLQERAITMLDEALRDTPGLFVEPIDGNRVNFYSRGFQITSLTYDGIPTTMDDRIFTPPDLAVFDRIEILKGPAGLLSGFGGPGGAINLVRKRPQADFTATVMASGGSWNNARLDADVGGSLAAEAALKGRFVGSFADGDSFQDWTHQRRELAYGVLEAEPAAGTVLSLGAYHQRNDYTGGWTLPSYAAYQNGHYVLSLLDVPRSTSLGEKWNDDIFTTDGLFASAEQRIAGDWKLVLGTQFLDNTLDRRMSYSYGAVTPGADTTTLYAQRVRYDQTQAGADLAATGSFDLFGGRHDATLGASYERTDFHARSANPQTAWSAKVDVFAPAADLPEPQFADWQRDATTLSETYGVYGGVRFNVGEALHLIGGVRGTWWNTRTSTAVPAGTPASSASIDGRATPNGGVVLDLDRLTALYAGITDVLSPQSYTGADGKVLEPLTGRQYEIGAKRDFPDHGAQASIALFQIDERNRAVADPRYPDDSVYLPQGKARSRGVELGLDGAVTEDWRVTAGYAYTFAEALDSSVSDSADFASIAPRHAFKLWTDYRLPASLDRRWRLGAGLNAQTAIFTAFPTLGNARLTQGGYATVDLRVGYEVTERIDAALNVKNLLDRTYYERIGSPISGNLYGAPRSLTFDLRARF